MGRFMGVFVQVGTFKLNLAGWLWVDAGSTGPKGP